MCVSKAGMACATTPSMSSVHFSDRPAVLHSSARGLFAALENSPRISNAHTHTHTRT